MTIKRDELRAFVRGVYDLQKMRIQFGQRIVSNAKVIEGIEPGEREVDNKAADTVMKKLRKEHKRMAEALSAHTKVKMLDMAIKEKDVFFKEVEAGETDVFHGIIASPIQGNTRSI